MLDDTSITHIVSWTRSGDSFVVRDMTEFAKTILPKYFKHNNFASFVRQLNKYDFHKAKSSDDSEYGKEAWEFQHDCFKYHNRDLLKEIKRKASKQPRPALDSGAAGLIGMPDMAKGDLLGDMYRDQDLLKLQLNDLRQSNMQLSSQLSALEMRYQSVLAESSQLKEAAIRQEEIIKLLVDVVTKPPSAVANASGPYSGADYLRHVAQQWLEKYSLSASAQPQLIQDPPPAAGAYRNSSFQRPPSGAASVHYPSAAATAPSIAPAVEPNGASSLYSLKTDMQHSQFNAASIAANGQSIYIPQANLPQQQQQQQQQPMYPSQAPLQREDPPAALSKLSSAMRINWKHAPRVLVVDDDQVYQKLYSKYLAGLGCMFDVVGDGHDAVECIRGGKKYDIVLMDILMPFMDGCSATSHIRSQGCKVPIISVTSAITEAECIKYIQNGMTDILAKPYHLNTLWNILKKYCSHLEDVPAVFLHQTENSNTLVFSGQSSLLGYNGGDPTASFRFISNVGSGGMKPVLGDSNGRIVEIHEEESENKAVNNASGDGGMVGWTDKAPAWQDMPSANGNGAAAYMMSSGTPLYAANEMGNKRRRQ